MRIDSPVMTNAIITGSFSGSFVGSGNFEGLEADSVEFANVLNKPTLLSGSAQIASDISGSFTSVSSSLAADIATNTAAIANLDGSYATDAELNASSSALITAYGNADTTLSASLATDIAANTAKVGYTDTLVKTKLNNDDVVSGSAAQVRSFLNVEDGADVTDTANVTAAGALMDSELTDLAGIKALTVSSKQDVLAEGAFVDGDKTKLDGIETGATGDMSDAEIKTAYENNSNTNAFTDALLSKLNGIEASADVTDTDNVTAAGALMDSEVDADIKTLSLPANTTISSFAKTFLDDADAAAVRATIGAEASGADNSTDVTLVTTSHDYLSLSGQAITLGQIDISDDTNLAVSDTTGQTGINLSLTGDTISGVVSGLDTTSNVQFNDVTVAGNLTVTGTTTSINSTDLNVTDKLISINRGGSTAASADGGGLFISGANESITWDNGNSRFSFSDDVHAAGNITLTGTVDGRNIASDGSKLDGIEANATADQTAAEIRTLVESATDSNVFTDADHSKLNGIESGATADQSDAEIETAYNNRVAQVSSAERTAGTATAIKRFAPADIKSMIDTHQSDTVYTHPTHPGDDFSVDTGALTGATVISDIDINVTTDALGHVTDANGSVATRTLTKADIGLGNVENTALSTWAGSSNITTLGTIGTGTWNGSVIASAYLDADTAHLSGTQTFSGAKTFSTSPTIKNSNLRLTNSSNAEVATLSHTGTHTKIESHLGGIILDNMGTSGGTLQVTGSIDTNDEATFGDTLRVKSSGLFGNSTNYYAKIQGNTTNGAEILGSTNGTFSANTGIAIAGSTTTVRGTLRSTGDVVAYYSSDERLKDNVVEIDGALDKIEALRGVSFDWNDKQDVYEGHDIGVIAQDVEAVLPEIVETRDNGYKAVKYEKLTAVLIQAVKELSAKVKELENK